MNRILFIIACQLTVLSSLLAGPRAVCEAAERFYATFNGSLPKNSIVIQDYPAKLVRIDLELLNGSQRMLPAIWNMGYETKGIGRYASKNQEYKNFSLEQLEQIETKVRSILQRLPSARINISPVDLTAKAEDVLEQTEQYRRELNERGFVVDKPDNGKKG